MKLDTPIRSISLEVQEIKLKIKQLDEFFFTQNFKELANVEYKQTLVKQRNILIQYLKVLENKISLLKMEGING